MLNKIETYMMNSVGCPSQCNETNKANTCSNMYNFFFLLFVFVVLVLCLNATAGHHPHRGKWRMYPDVIWAVRKFFFVIFFVQLLFVYSFFFFFVLVFAFFIFFFFTRKYFWLKFVLKNKIKDSRLYWIQIVFR